MKQTIIRDQVHGDVRLDPMSVALLNTPQMQRLGRVYQLGFAHLVYRGGNHTRLSHVIGTSYVAGFIVDNLRMNYEKANNIPDGAILPEEFLPLPSKKSGKESLGARWDLLRQLVVWAALLHDVAHVPLGHTLEDEFDNIYQKHDDFKSPRIEFIWLKELRAVLRNQELYPDSFTMLGVDPQALFLTVLTICLHKEKRKDNTTFWDLIDAELVKMKVAGLDSHFLEMVKSGERKSYFHPYMADIVGDTICADYLDYIMRDPLNVGLDILKDKRVISKYFIGTERNRGLLRMALSLENDVGKPRLDTSSGVVDLVRQRFRFAEIIYYHKTKVSASAMLAKVFALVGVPDEIPRDLKRLTLEEIPDLADSLSKKKDSDLSELKAKYLPTAILDPSIGDDSLLLWLRYQLWEKVAQSGKSGPSMSNLLIALRLLQSITDRRLYKVCFQMDKVQYFELRSGSKQEKVSTDSLDRLIKKLRSDSNYRSDIEKGMCEAAGLPLGSFILYVPPKKSQAKGIETGALDKGEVVTLGEHSVIKEHAKALGEEYERIWKILVFVSPEYLKKNIKMSIAIDQLLVKLFEEERTKEMGPEDGCWFEYIAPQFRKAALQYINFCRGLEVEPDWKHFQNAELTHEDTMEYLEYSVRASLLTLKCDGQAIASSYPNSRKLKDKLSELSGEEINFYGGVNERHELLPSIQKIAIELRGGATL